MACIPKELITNYQNKDSVVDDTPQAKGTQAQIALKGLWMLLNCLSSNQNQKNQRSCYPSDPELIFNCISTKLYILNEPFDLVKVEDEGAYELMRSNWNRIPSFGFSCPLLILFTRSHAERAAGTLIDL